MKRDRQRFQEWVDVSAGDIGEFAKTVGKVVNTPDAATSIRQGGFRWSATLKFASAAMAVVSLIRWSLPAPPIGLPELPPVVDVTIFAIGQLVIPALLFSPIYLVLRQASKISYSMWLRLTILALAVMAPYIALCQSIFTLSHGAAIVFMLVGIALQLTMLVRGYAALFRLKVRSVLLRSLAAQFVTILSMLAMGLPLVNHL